MNRLIVCGALVFAGFSGLMTGCGSRSSMTCICPERHRSAATAVAALTSVWLAESPARVTPNSPGAASVLRVQRAAAPFSSRALLAASPPAVRQGSFQSQGASASAVPVVSLKEALRSAVRARAWPRAAWPRPARPSKLAAAESPLPAVQVQKSVRRRGCLARVAAADPEAAVLAMPARAAATMLHAQLSLLRITACAVSLR